MPKYDHDLSLFLEANKVKTNRVKTNRVKTNKDTSWGVGSFIWVIMSIFLITPCLSCQQTQVSSGDTTPDLSDLRQAQEDAVKDKLQGYKDLWRVVKDGRTLAIYNSKDEASKHFNKDKSEKVEKLNKMQIPIERAMEIVAFERAKEFKLPKSTIKAPVATKATPPPPFTVDATLAAKGKQLFTAKICNSCHSIDGSKIVGPTMKGIWGRKERLTDGSEIYVNEAYFVQSIKDPMSQIVEGYPPAMAQVAVTDDEIKALLHYVASIK